MISGRVGRSATLAGIALVLASTVIPGQARGVMLDPLFRDAIPVKVLRGPSTELSEPAGLAFDAAGFLYIANTKDNSVTAYGPGWKSGDTAPVKVLKGPLSLLDSPTAVAFDDDGQMYVANSSSISVYPADWSSGDTKPIRLLSGDGTSLSDPQAIAFDSTGRMYVSNQASPGSQLGGTITVYAADWASGSTRPVNTLAGSSTALIGPMGIAFDTEGTMYVANAYGISTFDTSWTIPNTAPTKILTGPGSGMDRPSSITFDDAGYMYVANAGQGRLGVPHVNIYAGGWSSGNEAPVGVILGRGSQMTDPYGLAMDDDGVLYVTNNSSRTVTAFQTQTINQVDQPSVPWTSTSTTVTATSTSGLGVEIVTTNPSVCTGSGTSPVKVTVIAIGTCTFDIKQVGAGTTLPAPAVTASFSVTAAPQSISVKDIAEQPLAKKWVIARASTTSGLPVVWSSSTPDVCTTTKAFGQRIRLVAPGTCSLSASQSGNRLWQSAETATLSFTVAQ